jgi:hypothetical protein
MSINFICKDSVALWRDFLARGLSAKRPFVGNGMWVTQVSDPDGYDLSFESLTDVPEDTLCAGVARKYRAARLVNALTFGPWRRHSRGDLRYPQSKDQHFPVCDQFIAGRIFRSRRSGGTFHQCVTAGCASKQKLILDPFSFPIHSRINAVKPFRPFAACGDANIVRGSSHPGLPTFIENSGLLPETHMVSFGDRIQSFLKYNIGWGTVQCEQRNRRSLIATFSGGSLQLFHR